MKKKKSVFKWLILISIISLGSCSTYQGVGNTKEASRSQRQSQQKTWTQFNSVK